MTEYHKNNVHLYCMDNMKLMAKYPDNHFHWAFLDPPYGIDRDVWDNRPPPEYWAEIFRISENQIIFGGNYFNLPITESWLCWDKTNNGKSFFKHKAKFELIWLSVKQKPDFIRYTLDGNVEGFENIKPNYKKQKAIHSCQKPVPVYDWLFQKFTNKKMKIIDTHLGSFSSAISAEKTNVIEFIGCEIDTEIFKKGINRFKNETAQLRMF